MGGFSELIGSLPGMDRLLPSRESPETSPPTYVSDDYIQRLELVGASKEVIEIAKSLRQEKGE